MVKAFLEYLELEKKYSIRTIVAYRKDLESFNEFYVNNYNEDDFSNTTYHQIRAWIVFMVESGLTHRTINRKTTALNSYFKFLCRLNFLSVNPMASHKSLKTQKKVQIPFSIDEIQAVINEVSSTLNFEDIRNKLIVELFYSTGIRRSELVNLKLSDIDFSQNKLRVLGKRDKERFVVILPTVENTLKSYLNLRNELLEDELDYIFITKRGQKIYDTLVYRVINTYFSNVSTKVKKSPHILRHSFATLLLNQGADLNSVKELLGHSSIASTQVYTHNSLEQLKKVFNKTHPRSSNS